MSPIARVLFGLTVALVGAFVALLTAPFCVSAVGCGGASLMFYDSVHAPELVELFGYLMIPSMCGSIVFLPLIVIGVVIIRVGPKVRMGGVGGASDSDNVFDPPRREA